VTGERIAVAIQESHTIKQDHILVEPMPKNTLGALCWAVARLRDLGYGEDDTMAVLTADHAIGVGFEASVSVALDLAEETGGLVTIGIEPTRAETGYGYIRTAEGFRVKGFTEKPDPATAEQYAASGEYLWNSGMFFWKIGAFVRELRSHEPDASQILDRLASDPAAFSDLVSAPIDRALMEKSSDIFVVPATFAWDDVGAWDAVARTRTADESGNVLIGNASEIDSSGCIIHSEHIPVGVIGVEDLIVVATSEGVLVCHKSQAQRVREVATRLRDEKS
jgi:mannose-1-phosphate guanylyltransferase/mannose-6-phosphate isomerase